jgi:hypothetical protein
MTELAPPAGTEAAGLRPIRPICAFDTTPSPPFSPYVHVVMPAYYDVITVFFSQHIPIRKI